MKHHKRDYEVLIWTILLSVGLIAFGIFVGYTLGGIHG